MQLVLLLLLLLHDGVYLAPQNGDDGLEVAAVGLPVSELLRNDAEPLLKGLALAPQLGLEDNFLPQKL